MPRVFDNKGHELVVGARVERVSAGGIRGGMVGTVRMLGGVDPGDVYVKWPGQPYGLPFKSRRRVSFTRLWFARTYTCPDLQIIDSPSERKG